MSRSICIVSSSPGTKPHLFCWSAKRFIVLRRERPTPPGAAAAAAAILASIASVKPPVRGLSPPKGLAMLRVMRRSGEGVGSMLGAKPNRPCCCWLPGAAAADASPGGVCMSLSAAAPADAAGDLAPVLLRRLLRLRVRGEVCSSEGAGLAAGAPAAAAPCLLVLRPPLRVAVAGEGCAGDAAAAAAAPRVVLPLLRGAATVKVHRQKSTGNVHQLQALVGKDCARVACLSREVMHQSNAGPNISACSCCCKCCLYSLCSVGNSGRCCSAPCCLYCTCHSLCVCTSVLPVSSIAEPSAELSL
jgi:hypothetical protein